jgi:hypothetical protein
MTQDATSINQDMVNRIFAVILLVVVVAALAVIIFGLPALGIIGLLMTAGFFALMLAFMAGN